MRAKYLFSEDIVVLDPSGSILLESLYDDIRKPIFIDVIDRMSTKIGTFKKDGNVYKRTTEICGNLSVSATLNIEDDSY